MYIKSPWLSLAYKVCVFVFGAWVFAGSLGVWRGAPDFKQLYYFTYLSNLLCLAYFFGAAVQQAVCLPRRVVFLPRAKGALVMGILLTMTVYHFLLGGYHGSLYNRTLHYYVPMLTFLDWLLFDRKGAFRPSDPLGWTVLPLAYLAFILLRARYGRAILYEGRFPYPFLNADALGWAAVRRNCLVIFIVFMTAGYLFYLLDWLLGKGLAKGQKDSPKARE